MTGGHVGLGAEDFSTGQKTQFYLPHHLRLMPPFGDDPIGISHHKTKVHGLSCGFVSEILCLAVFMQYRLVTDERTDRQTDTR